MKKKNGNISTADALLAKRGELHRKPTVNGVFAILLYRQRQRFTGYSLGHTPSHIRGPKAGNKMSPK
jgi:hypothetical protein